MFNDKHKTISWVSAFFKNFSWKYYALPIWKLTARRIIIKNSNLLHQSFIDTPLLYGLVIENLYTH